MQFSDDPQANPEDIGRAVLKLINSRIEKGEVEDIRQALALPNDLAELLPYDPGSN